MAYRRTERVNAQLAAKRSRILAAARRLISDGGFHEAPISAVAALADVAVGTVYRYFPSKGELFAEVIGTTSQRELEVVAAVVVADGSAAERLAGAIRVFSGRALRGRRLAYALVAEPVAPEVDAIRLKYRRALARVFQTLIEQGIATAEFPPQNAGAAAACLAGACFEGLVGPLSPETITTPKDAEALMGAISAFCLRAVGAAHLPGGTSIRGTDPDRSGPTLNRSRATASRWRRVPSGR